MGATAARSATLTPAASSTAPMIARFVDVGAPILIRLPRNCSGPEMSESALTNISTGAS